MRSSLFWNVTQRRLEFTEVSEQPIGTFFRSKAVPKQKSADLIYTAADARYYFILTYRSFASFPRVAVCIVRTYNSKR